MSQLERRQVLKGATVVAAGVAAAPLLAACGGGGSGGAASDPAGGSGGTAASGSAGDSGITLAKSNVPVGGGVVDGVVVVVQPTAGDFKAYSAVCTHQQCLVGAVTDGFIVCPCHNSHFAIADGAPTAESMAKSPLHPKTVTVTGDALVIS
jgi:nitrite reductase/ring-hydroxylating ferredoxin subunit